MSDTNGNLARLLDEVDGWFSDPAYHAPISRSVRLPSVGKKKTLDCLVKDLEMLLEEESDGQQQDVSSTYVFHQSYCDEELAMLDKSIGYCCTLAKEGTPQLSKKEWSSLSQNDIRESSLWRQETNYDDDDGDDNEQDGLNNNRKNINHQQQHDLKVQTNMPMDHDYLPKPQTKPLLLSNKLLQVARNKQNRHGNNNNISKSSSSVINTEALKRLAPFSDQIRLLSNKYSRLFSVKSE